MLVNGISSEVTSLRDTAAALSRMYVDGDMNYRKSIAEMVTNTLETTYLRCGTPRNARSLSSARFWLAFLECHRNPSIMAEAQPSWLTQTILQELQVEAERQKPDCATAKGPVFGWEVGVATKLLADNPLVKQWAETAMGRRFARMEFMYIFYEVEAQFCPVHIDLPDLDDHTCLVSLKHESGVAGTASLMRFFLPDGERDFPMVEGDTLIFHGSATAHGRTPLCKQERVWSLSIGLN